MFVVSPLFMEDECKAGIAYGGEKCDGYPKFDWWKPCSPWDALDSCDATFHKWEFEVLGLAFAIDEAGDNIIAVCWVNHGVFGEIVQELF